MTTRLSLTTLLLFFAMTASAQQPTAADIRQAISGEIASFNIPPEAVVKVEDRTIPFGQHQIPVRLYYPGKDKVYPVILNIHGGALVAGDLSSHDNISRALANRTNAIVVALDYRKPPEAPFPAGLDDTEAVLAWVRKMATSFGGDQKRILLVGDSGGALFIASLMAKLKPADFPAGIALINPPVDLRNLTNPMYALVTGWYLNGHSADDPVASPILSEPAKGYPPTLLITSEKDELKPQGLSYFNKLQAAGVKARHVDLPGVDHLGGAWAANHPMAKPALDETVAFVQSLTGK